jgi:ABC-2 type transport system ATP-binding protein
MENVIETYALTVRFGRLTAVNGVTLSVRRGEIFGFLGPNGSGKTTLIKALCGLVPIASGGGAVLGYDVRTHVREIKRRIGYMSQKFGLYEDLTVNENLDFYGGVYGLRGADLERRKRDVVELTSLGPYMHRRGALLSGGWKQRLALACSIIHTPQVVFLDEPTAGIDPVARRALWDLLFELSARGVTFFVTTHYMDEAERCARVGYIHLGDLIASGSVDEIQRLPDANPPDTERVSIHVPNAGAALESVRRLPYVHEATIFGRSIHALVDSGRRQELSYALDPAGWADVRPVPPSLEDVFVTLTRKIMSRAESRP